MSQTKRERRSTCEFRVTAFLSSHILLPLRKPASLTVSVKDYFTHVTSTLPSLCESSKGSRCSFSLPALVSRTVRSASQEKPTPAMPLFNHSDAAQPTTTTHEKPLQSHTGPDSPAGSTHPINNATGAAGASGVDVGDQNGAGRAWIYQRPSVGEWFKMYWVDLREFDDLRPSAVPWTLSKDGADVCRRRLQ